MGHGVCTNYLAMDGLSLIVVVVPWGRFMPLREDITAGFKTKEEGGTGVSKQFWDWTVEQVKPYI